MIVHSKHGISYEIKTLPGDDHDPKLFQDEKEIKLSRKKMKTILNKIHEGSF